MPAEGVPLTPKPHLLTVDEIVRIVEVSRLSSCKRVWEIELAPVFLNEII